MGKAFIAALVAGGEAMLAMRAAAVSHGRDEDIARGRALFLDDEEEEKNASALGCMRDGGESGASASNGEERRAPVLRSRGSGEGAGESAGEGESEGEGEASERRLAGERLSIARRRCVSQSSAL